jgi:hypothetical protein
MKMFGERNMSSKAYKVLLFLFTAFLVAFLISDKHRGIQEFHWKSEIFADPAGYYVYLPALFIYNFDAQCFPEKMDEKTGMGFRLDRENNKVLTKYTCGLAIMQSPVFLMIHCWNIMRGHNSDGFSGNYHEIPNIAAFIYLLLAFYFLFRFLKFYFNDAVSILSIALIFLGTNLFYYSIDSTGMSHVYSFFLISAFLFHTKKNMFQDKYRLVDLFIWALLLGMIILIRPSNLIISLVFFMDAARVSEMGKRLKTLLKPMHILIIVFAMALVFLPQLMYWKYLSGTFIYYSYQEEGFSNWLKPQFTELFFAPRNGLFLYSPLYLLMFIYMIFFIRKRNIWIILSIFILLSYITASWHMVYFGCGFGNRNFVEFTPLFAISLGFFIQNSFWKAKKYAYIILLVFLALINLKLSYALEKCFFGTAWEWKEYKYLLLCSQRTFFEDFENKSNPDCISYADAISGNRVYYFRKGTLYSGGFHIKQKKYALSNFRTAIISFHIHPMHYDHEDLHLICSVDDGGENLFHASLPVRDFLKQRDGWNYFYGVFILPKNSPLNSTVKFFLLKNKPEEELLLDAMKLKLE